MKFPSGEHPVTSSAVSYVNHEDEYRNVWVVYQPPSHGTTKQLLKCTNARISDCNNFYLEDIAPADMPEKKIGIAKIPITPIQRNHFKKEEIIKDFKLKATPSVLVFD